MPITTLKGKYEVHELISEDIISYIHEGVEIADYKKLLIWKYKEEYLPSALVEELVKTADKLMSLSHPNLLPIKDYDYDGHYFYVIYDAEEPLLSLEAFFREEQSMTLQALWQIIRQVLSAMMAIESIDLIHGNLNLSTILVTEKHDVKLVNTALSNLIIRHSLDEFEVVDDCIFYAPEFLQRKQVDIRSDIYSFGVLLYICFSRKWPYKYTSNVLEMKKELLKDPLPFVRVSSKLPDNVEAMIYVCLQKEPLRRFQNFTNLVRFYRNEITQDEAVANAQVSPTLIENEIKQDITQRRFKNVLGLAGKLGIVAAVVVLLGIGYGFYKYYLTSIPTQIVPAVVGLDQEKALALLQEHHLKGKVTGSRAHPGYVQGMVIESIPPSGREVKQNRLVRLIISKGNSKVVVPELTGRTLPQAISVLEERGLRLRVEEEVYSASFRKGTIVSQIPSPNETITATENVSVSVSKGFPVNISVTNAEPGFFSQRDEYRNVTVSFSILSDWPPQEVRILFKYNELMETLYSKYHFPNEDVSLQFELERGGAIEVYFNDELGLRSEIDGNSVSTLQ